MASAPTRLRSPSATRPYPPPFPRHRCDPPARGPRRLGYGSV